MFPSCPLGLTNALASLQPLPGALCPQLTPWIPDPLGTLGAEPTIYGVKPAFPRQRASLFLSLSPQNSVGPQQPGLCSPHPRHLTPYTWACAVGEEKDLQLDRSVLPYGKPLWAHWMSADSRQ